MFSSDVELAAGSVSQPFRSLLPRRHSSAAKIFLLVFLFSSELIVLSIWLDGGSLVQRGGLIGIIGGWGAWILRYVIGYATLFLTFAFLRYQPSLQKIARHTGESPVRWSFFLAHVCTMGVFALLSFRLYGPVKLSSWDNLLALSWFVVGVCAIGLAAFAFLSLAFWTQLLRYTGYLWIYASMAAALACSAGAMLRRLWKPASYLTLYLTKILLRLFVPGVIANPAAMLIGTPRFQVEIAPQCSGLEGVGLILAFSILWLLVFRKECRFPQALLLIPVGIVLIFFLNSMRIAALILIGNAGAERIALGGFHSQAGWIAFSAVGVGLCFIVRRVPWFTAPQQNWEKPETEAHNPAAAFLLPFMAILAAAMIAGAARPVDGVEWLYPLRFFAAACALWFFRRSYTNLGWRCSWLAPLIGAVVFAIWIALDRPASPVADQEVSAAFMGSSTMARILWITFRVLSAVVTVPLAEELAFRGFLMRRLISPAFDSVSFHRFSWSALLLSSVAFGLLHGGYWIPGSIAGVFFGLAVIRRGHIGDAVVAHATANALLALYVLTYHRWHLW
ncbi:MAG: exosortase E/protease, VPEID-CTERM system [Terriglobales bacterium]